MTDIKACIGVWIYLKDYYLTSSDLARGIKILDIRPNEHCKEAVYYMNMLGKKYYDKTTWDKIPPGEIWLPIDRFRDKKYPIRILTIDQVLGLEDR